jgi:oxygen-independent coproporphyrinogen-3 oxidase
MIGLPEQTLSEVERSVERLLELDPPHVTVYLYRQDARTVLDRQIKQGVKQAKSEEEKAQHEDLACGLLERAGYSQYMTSYYAKSPSDFFQCEDYYFSFQGDSLGLGSGAASILGCHSLYNDPRNLHRFLEDPLRFDRYYKFQPFLPIDNLPFVQEALLTRTGLNFEAFRKLYGFEFADATNHRAFRAFLVALKRIGAYVRRTPEGIHVSRSAAHDDRPVSQQMFLAARNSPAVVEESESIFDF